MPTYYEILGCDKNASYEELKKCYHDKIKKHHPDKSGVESRQIFLLLDKAWKTLRNEKTRKEYDLVIGKNEPNEMPLYCEVELSEMSYEPETGSFSYVCRCGGTYLLEQSDLDGFEEIQISCDECTFHIVVKSSK